MKKVIFMLLAILMIGCNCDDQPKDKCDCKVYSSYSIRSVNEFGMQQVSNPPGVDVRDTIVKCKFDELVFYKVETTDFPSGAYIVKTTVNKIDCK